MSSLALRRPGRLALGHAAPWWRRSPSRVGRWVLAAGLAVLAAALFTHLTGQATDTVAGWGHTRSVIVARRDLAPGQVVATDDIVRRDLPDAAVPASALVDDPTGRVVTSPIIVGEVVSRQRLAPDGLQGIAALVPDGHRAIAVPTAGTGLHLRIGDRVDVFAPGRTDGGSTRSDRADAVAAGAVVVDVGETAVTVAVDRTEVAALARALGQGTPVLALVGGG
jgi:Flp pilus assembly protein CpaB